MTPNRNAERGRATREHLIEVATRLFAEHGYDGTSVESVLVEAGVSRGSLYHHFPGKDALFAGVLEALNARIFSAVMGAAEQADNAVDLLRLGTRAWMRLAADPTVQRILLVDAPVVLGWERWRRLDEDNLLGEIKLALSGVVATGGIRAEHVDVFSHIVLAAINEMALMIARSDDLQATLDGAEEAVDEFLRRLLGSA
jgi:AcrR family transcriptional regulator